MKVEINQTINKIEITSKGKVEIKDNVMPIDIYKCKGGGGGDSRPYKVYTALLDFISGVPIAIVLENTLGFTINWSRIGIGHYNGTPVLGFFDIEKTLVFFSLPPDANGNNLVRAYTSGTVDIFSEVIGSGQQDILNEDGYMPIEIRVYN
jgi:hypothetical protein